MKAEVGTRVRLLKPQGRKRVVEVDGQDTIEWDLSEDAGHLPAGSEGVVVAIVPADVDGVGDRSREHVAVRFGPEEHGHPDQRHWSYPSGDFDKVFEVVAKSKKGAE